MLTTKNLVFIHQHTVDPLYPICPPSSGNIGGLREQKVPIKLRWHFETGKQDRQLHIIMLQFIINTWYLLTGWDWEKNNPEAFTTAVHTAKGPMG